MGIPVSVEIDEAQLYKDVLIEMAAHLNKILSGMSKDGVIAGQVATMVDQAIRSSPEYDSLLNGELRAVFGLTNPAGTIEEIISIVKSNIEIEASPVRTIGIALTGRFTIRILRSDMVDVLSASGARFDSEGGEVNWLSWLLTAGDSIVIGDHDFSANIGNAESRTGAGIMVRSNSGFRVPPEFSGTLTDNWLTRSIQDLDEQIGNIIYVELVRRLN